MKTLRNALVCLIILPRFLLAALVLWFLDFLCVRKRVLYYLRDHDDDDDDEDEDPPLCISDNNRMFSWESLKAVFHGHEVDWMKSARVGRDAPNTEVVELSDLQPRRILDFARRTRPLVLNFGSCS
ncbi:Thyroxine 5-deiodinase [Triplophysa tibetana]|uniref:Iodothyronine deiodinase n=1 Tax=Triplophysa tibetana TaxID=1572043 RepID=A0A5A9NTV2_9TELE|nr:Thyroxine 5-deiodinase [Triplophysa tibetana]